MRVFLFFSFSIFAAFFITETLLYCFARLKSKKALKKTEKGINLIFALYMLVLFLSAGWMFLFKDSSVYLECRQESLSCSYFHTTLSSNKMYPVRKYDIALITRAKVREHREKRNGLFYTVDMIGIDRSFELPPHFNNSGDAQKEVTQINRFLTDKKDIYTYRLISTLDPFTETVLFLFLLTGIALEICVLRDLIEDIVERRKEKIEEENKKRKNETVSSFF